MTAANSDNWDESPKEIPQDGKPVTYLIPTELTDPNTPVFEHVEEKEDNGHVGTNQIMFGIICIYNATVVFSEIS